MGAAVVARLHAEPEFRAAIEAAKAELVAVRAKGLSPQRDCEAEAAALSHNQQPTPQPTNNSRRCIAIAALKVFLVRFSSKIVCL